MKQTPAHDLPNTDLLAVMPAAERIVEVGCSRGALARAFKQKHPNCQYLGIEIDATYAEAARNHCDQVLIGDIEDLFRRDAFKDLTPAQCWVFGDTLEHLRDPWLILDSIRPLLTTGGCVCACIPNMQHWSIQLRLNTGHIEYTDSGLLDRTHLRWFTRSTIEQLFTSTGFMIEQMNDRIFPHEHTEAASQVIGEVARRIGHDPERAITDALPLQYVIRAVTAPTSSQASGPH